MSRVKTNQSVQEIDNLLKRTEALMEQQKAKGNYVQAENCRIAIEQMKKDREARRIRDMQRRHKQEQDTLANQCDFQTKQLYQSWEKRLNEEASEAERSLKELKTRHIIEQQRTREQLEIQSPMKVKESTECLNLRKMEECMVKQKNYAQAHIIQNQIAEMVKAEKDKWVINRSNKIELALKHLRDRHEKEFQNLNKNIKATLNESKKIKQKEEETLNLKFSNLQRELTMKQQKQKIAHRGEFTSKGGEGSPLLTKSRLLKNQY